MQRVVNGFVNWPLLLSISFCLLYKFDQLVVFEACVSVCVCGCGVYLQLKDTVCHVLILVVLGSKPVVAALID